MKKKARKARKGRKLYKRGVAFSFKTRKLKKAGKKRKPSAAFMRAMSPDATLASVIGSSAMPRSEIYRRILSYIRRNKLLDSRNPRMIRADERLKAVFRGKSYVSLFEMTKLVNKHLDPGSGNNPGPRNKERN